jgi:hypothetical protein
MIEAIEEEARMPNKLPADVFKLIESCLNSLGQKAKKQDRSDEVIKQKEPERLLQVEAIREHATILHGTRLNGDKLGEESVKKAMVRLVDEFMVAVDKDKDNGLDPDTAWMWKIRCTRSRLRRNLTNHQRASVGANQAQLHTQGQQTASLPSNRSLSRRPTPWKPRQGR